MKYLAAECAHPMGQVMDVSVQYMRQMGQVMDVSVHLGGLTDG